MAPLVSLRGGSVGFGSRVLWSGLDLDVEPGEFVAVLGPNGAGKTTLLRVLLGQLSLRAGEARINGRAPRRGSDRIGYVPQQKTLDDRAPIRGRDLVGLGLDGHRWGLGLPSKARTRRIDDAIAEVGATAFADAPLHMLSGGEQQRLRIAQALVTVPELLLCDEPLLSLDLHHQMRVAALIHHWCVAHGSAVIFVTHEINPILPVTDKVVYLAGGKATVGTVDEVMRSEVLSELFDADVEVVRHGDRIMVFGIDDHPHHAHDEEVL